MIFYITLAIVCIVASVFLVCLSVVALQDHEPPAALIALGMAVVSALGAAASIDAVRQRANPEPTPTPSVSTCTCVVAEHSDHVE